MREEIDIKELTDKLIEMAMKSCWNNFSDSYVYILSEIINDGKSFSEQRKERKRANSKKKKLSLELASKELDALYPDLYDVNFFVYKASKKNTIIEIRYFLKSSFDRDYYEDVKSIKPMLHCKICIPPYLKDERQKFDVNWELEGFRFKWNAFWKIKLKKIFRNN